MKDIYIIILLGIITFLLLNPHNDRLYCSLNRISCSKYEIIRKDLTQAEINAYFENDLHGKLHLSREELEYLKSIK